MSPSYLSQEEIIEFIEIEKKVTPSYPFLWWMYFDYFVTTAFAKS